MDQAHIDFWLKEFERFTTAIVANGEVPSSGLSMRLLRKMRRIVCCDGALQKLLSVNIIPDVVVGDGDSMDAEILQEQADVENPQTDSDFPCCRDAKFCVSTKGQQIPYHQDRSEEYNDLQKALKYCMANGYDNILLMGCAGLREDHFIANLSIMVMYSEKLHLAMLTEHGVFNVIRSKGTFYASPGMQVSVFARNPHSRLTFTGLKYPVNNRSFNWLWEGSLNEAVSESFTVTAGDDEPVVVYRAVGNEEWSSHKQRW
jgi:thiamine pyrophosphokinase